MPTGRFAPSPSGDLHLGNLRTALIAWLAARSTASAFAIRMEDLEQSRVRPEYYTSQLDDLAALGLDWDGPVIRQTDRIDQYEAAITQLVERDLTYPCFCSRRDIREATQAPHGQAIHYPGTCRDLDSRQRAERAGAGRTPALRLRANDTTASFVDLVVGEVSGLVDDFVLLRNDGLPAYNLAVVVDDVAQDIELVVRGDDLAQPTLGHIYLAGLLGLAVPSYAHVPLVLAPSGERLAKRDGAVTLADRLARGESADDVVSFLASTVGLCEAGERVQASDLVERFRIGRLPQEPYTLLAAVIAPLTG